MIDFVTRFAPSPTGRLHLGHAYSALMAFNAARAAGGRFLLRIEDIDQTRCKAEFEQAIFDDLAWLGLEWESPARRQSDHFGDYEEALQSLINRGLAYRCFKTRREILDDIARAPHLTSDGPEGPAYIGEPLPRDEEQSLIGRGAPFAWRLSMAAARSEIGERFNRLTFSEESEAGIHEQLAKPAIFGDVIVARKDSGTSYHLASVHDDAMQGITHVIRGDDLRAAAHLHRLLQELLDYPAPVYRHHKLILGDDGRRLAKRDHAATIASMRASGATPADIRRRLGL